MPTTPAPKHRITPVVCGMHVIIAGCVGPVISNLEQDARVGAACQHQSPAGPKVWRLCMGLTAVAVGRVAYGADRTPGHARVVDHLLSGSGAHCGIQCGRCVACAVMHGVGMNEAVCGSHALVCARYCGVKRRLLLKPTTTLHVVFHP